MQEPTPPNNQTADAGGGIPFQVDQLFAAYGAKEFENQLLRAEIQRLNQQVTTLSRVIKDLERDGQAE